MLPNRIPKDKNRTLRWKSQAHCNFVRGHECSNSKCQNGRPIEVAHVRSGTDGGTGRKPSDYWTISLCRDCHALQHRIGEPAFERETGIDMKELAIEFANASPKRMEIRIIKGE